VPRRRLADEMVQTSMRLPRELFDQLTQVAGERGTSTEIRRRLEASLSGEAPAEGDPKTRALLVDLARAARAVEDAYGPWHNDPYAREILRSLAAMLIGPVEPVKPRPPRKGSGLANALQTNVFRDTGNAEDVANVLYLLMHGVRL
jgi:hypothetical protein